MNELSKQVAIISGGLGDIGRAIAIDLARRGARIAIGDVLASTQAAAKLRELKQLGFESRYDRVDVSDAKAVTRWIATVEKDIGTPTLIIPNAAIVAPANLRQLTAEYWRRELSVNLDGAFYLAHAGAMNLVQRKKAGRIVFVGSWAGHVPHRHIPTYCVAKAGMRMLCQQFALEFAADGILCNEVAPGYVDAGLSGRMFAKDKAMKRRATKRVPIQKLIEPIDVARQVAHLCDPQNQHMTGSVIVMDGGLSLGKQ